MHKVAPLYASFQGETPVCMYCQQYVLIGILAADLSELTKTSGSPQPGIVWRNATPSHSIMEYGKRSDYGDPISNLIYWASMETVCLGIPGI